MGGGAVEGVYSVRNTLYSHVVLVLAHLVGGGHGGGDGNPRGQVRGHLETQRGGQHCNETLRHIQRL